MSSWFSGRGTRPAAEELDDSPPWKFNSEFTPDYLNMRGKKRHSLSTSQNERCPKDV